MKSWGFPPYRPVFLVPFAAGVEIFNISPDKASNSKHYSGQSCLELVCLDLVFGGTSVECFTTLYCFRALGRNLLWVMEPFGNLRKAVDPQKSALNTYKQFFCTMLMDLLKPIHGF